MTDRQVFARKILEIASVVEREEERIKREILRAARSGDCRAVEEIVARWLHGPVLEVLGPHRDETAESGQQAKGSP